MTKEPIMIDDVDVSKCEYHRDTHKELLADKNIKIFANYCQINNDGCYAINCYYKQLKRKEQQLKDFENEYEGFAVKYTDMEIALKRKEEECEFLKNITTLQSRDMHDKKQQLDQLKAEKKEVEDFLSDTASCIDYDGNPPANLDEVYICIEDIVKVNYYLNKNAKLYRKALQEIKSLCFEQNLKVDFFACEILQKCEVLDANIQSEKRVV